MKKIVGKSESRKSPEEAAAEIRGQRSEVRKIREQSYGLWSIVNGLFTTNKWLWTTVYGLLTLSFAHAQTNGPVTLSSPNTTGNYSSNVSVTSTPGFTSTAPFSAKIQAIDCLPLTTTPTLTQNYVISNTPRIAGFTNESQLSGQGTCALNQSIQYVDGLGRPIQSIQVMASPFGNDIIQPQAYDQFGREDIKYLPYTPYTGTAGSYRPNAVSTDQGAFYTSPPAGVTKIANPYAQTNFDNSPLNRAVEQGAPGAAWQLSTSGVTSSGHTVKMVYTVNNAISFSADSVNGMQAAMYYTTINGSTLVQTLNANGYYPANTLTVTIAKDENWVSGRAGTVEEYKDIDGQVVLKRTYNYTGGVLQMLSTYYVYDDRGKLAFVLPPASGADGAGAISAATLNNLCYQYQYDGLGRQVQKRLPGKTDWDYIVYNVMDQPVATQDVNQRANNQWTFTKYDAQQRPIITGIWSGGAITASRQAAQAALDAATTNLYETSTTTGNGYTNVALPTSGVVATLSINYYDSYTGVPNIPAGYSAPAGANLSSRGEMTASLTAVLNTPADQLWKVNYYDYFGRSMQGYAEHYLGGTVNAGNYDVVSTTYDFTNAPTTVTRKHWTTGTTLYPLATISNKYLYDHAGRKVKTWESIANLNNAAATALLSQVTYNEVGQTVNKQLHSTDSIVFYQNVAYAYNERGWLTSSTAPLFQMQLQYNTATAGKQYNGNIAYQSWVNPNISSSYSYSYDKLNRLTSGVSADNYKETGIAYDLMGNITNLSRYQANTLIDNLTYSYSSTNQLQNVVDASGSNTGLVNGTTAYTYDGNGNMLINANSTTVTQNKTFTYNLLNLPQTVVTNTAGTNTYTYDATGNRLRKVNVLGGVTKTTDYVNGIQYDGGALSFIQTEEGKAVTNGTSFTFNYYLGDNLGNTRVSFTNAGVTQVDDYYPFGMEIFRSVNGTKNEYLYNKKELQEELGQYDYGARFYDPVIARWATVDPMAEVSRRWSPYNYVENNPIRMIDPDGMTPMDGIEETNGQDHGKSQAEEWEEKDRAANEAYNAPKVEDNGIHFSNLDYETSGGGSPIENSRGFGELGNSNDDQGDNRFNNQTPRYAAGKPKHPKKEHDKDPLSSKVSRYTNYVAGGTIILGLGPEDPLTDVGAALEEVVGQVGAGVIKLGELAVDLWSAIQLTKQSGKNERHGDSGAVSRADKQIQDLEKQLSEATNNKEKDKIKQKIKNVRENAQRQKRGEEHSRANKR